MSSKPKTPKPADGSADAHREGKESVGGSDDDEELAEMPAGVSGGAGGDGGGGLGPVGGDDGGGGGGISINVRTIALGAGLVIAAYLAYKTFIDNGGVVDRSPANEGGQQADTDAQATAQESEDEVPDIPNDPQDPLRADDAAGEAVFDGWGE